jgi:hypothetical protein
VPSSKPKRGQVVNYECPVWKPLFELAPRHVDQFMWVHELELEDGARLHAYRHRETRRYLYLDHVGRAFVLLWDESRELDEGSLYEEADSRGLLDVALAKADGRATLFRQNIAKELRKLRWARSATKHRISKGRICHALENCRAILKEDPPAGNARGRAIRLVFLGEDSAGAALEVIAVPTDHANLMVIHAMELRPRYYEEVRRCNR